MSIHVFTFISISLLISVIGAQRVTIPGTSHSFTSCACGWYMGGDLVFGSYAQCPSGSKCLHLYYGSMGWEGFDCSGYQDLRVGFRLRTQSNAVTFQFHCPTYGSSDSLTYRSDSSASYQYYTYTYNNDCPDPKIYFAMMGNGYAYINDLWIEGIPNPTPQPTKNPTPKPTPKPTTNPTQSPSSATDEPSASPTNTPSKRPTNVPTKAPSSATEEPSKTPTKAPSFEPSKTPTNAPSSSTDEPSESPTNLPSKQPSSVPSKSPSNVPSKQPSSEPSQSPSNVPSKQPSNSPTNVPSKQPSKEPSNSPTNVPSKPPSSEPSNSPTNVPSKQPSKEPSTSPTLIPSKTPTKRPSAPTHRLQTHPSRKPTVFGEGMVDDAESTQMTGTVERDAVSEVGDKNSPLWLSIVAVGVICLCSIVVLWLLYKLKTNRKIEAQIADDLEPGIVDETRPDEAQNGGEDSVSGQESVSEGRPGAMKLDSAPQVVMTGIITVGDSGTDHESDASQDSLYKTRGNAFTTGDETADGMNVMGANEVRSWLNGIEQSKYYEIFTRNGFDSLDLVKQINDTEVLKAIGVSLIAHQLKILNEINKLKDETHVSCDTTEVEDEFQTSGGNSSWN